MHYSKTFHHSTCLRLFLLAGIIFITAAQSQAQHTVSIGTLLDEMTDRDRIARFPEPAFTCKQFSSYDRDSVASDKPGWFANRDRSMFLRVEKNNGRREFVMMDAAGPGAIVRFWMTFSGTDSGRGTLRIYIDDKPTPAIEGAAFDVLSGDMVSGPPLAASVSPLTLYRRRGHNLYFPIPYARRCKITYESEGVREDDYGAKLPGTEAVYYNINYRTYDSLTKVISYSKAEMQKNKKVATGTLALLAEKKKTPTPGGVIHRLDASLRPGESKTISVDKPGAIQHIALRLLAENQEQALRSTILEIAFDGEKTVWGPAGDFFGIGYMQAYASTWFTSADEDGLMQSWWVMPFAETCTLTLRNLGTQTVRVTDAAVNVKDWAWDHRSMHFGAGWRQYTRIFAGPHEQAVDLNFAHLEGKGVYVGDGVALFNTSYNWWGEGDEKAYVDGETFPSHFGTGTEDYYGYAWCRPEVFTDHPFVSQPVGTGNFSPRYTVNARVRALDGIPFTKSLRFDMELWKGFPSAINYAPVAYWYMLPGGRNLTSPDIDDAREPVALDRADIYPPVLDKTGGIEGENLLWLNTPRGVVSWQTHEKLRWSGGLQLHWRDAEVGNQAAFAFDSDAGGHFTLTAAFTVARDYGVFDIYLNGKKIFNMLDLGGRDLGVMNFKAENVEVVKGRNLLVVELVQHTEGAAKKSHFGLDRLDFK